MSDEFEMPAPSPEPPAHAAVESEPRAHRPSEAFIGKDGLRAGWSLIVFVLLLSALVFGVREIYTHAYPQRAAQARADAEHARRDPAFAKQKRQEAAQTESQMVPTATLKSHGAPFALFAAAALVMAFIERRKFSWYGFWSRTPLKDVAVGLFWGVACLALLVGVLRALHLLSFDGLLLHGRDALISALQWLAAFLLVGLGEEYLFRGYLQYTLARGIRGMFPPDAPHRRAWAFWIAAVALSLLFMATHLGNSGETTVGITAVFLAGLMLAYPLWRTGALWWGIGWHCGWDWAQSYLFGVGDSGLFVKGRLFATHPQGNPLLSGGSTGPEGSLLVIPTLLLAAIIMRFVIPQREQPPITPLSHKTEPVENNVPLVA